MNNKKFKKILGMLLSVCMVTVLAPIEIWAEDGATENNQQEASADAEASVEDSVGDEIKTEAISEASDKDEVENNAELLGTTNDVVVTIDDTIKNGTIEIQPVVDNRVTGIAKPNTDYDLATIRVLWTEGSSNKEQYVSYTPEGDNYTFEFDVPNNNCTITAFFFSTTVWDGAVDLTWYDPESTRYEIGSPAELAGLAAIVNGMVDENVTSEYMIKDNEGRASLEDESAYIHRYVSTYSEYAYLLTPNSAESGSSQVREKVWRLPEVSKSNPIAEDDKHHDMLYRTVVLTSDINMGDKNWTPIGGKYAMNPNYSSRDKARVIDTRFQGIFDGQGHTVTINTNRHVDDFAYSWELGLIGYLGGGVDYDLGYPKDIYVKYSKKWTPTVKNVIVKGSISGNRIVGGVVGRIGETENGVIVENCANYASVDATDMRGCAGIVAAAWGKSIIRNCYNAGHITCARDEVGGICGSNGYEGSVGHSASGADIVNCFNVGTIERYTLNTENYYYDGKEIGIDGNGFASYKIANCYYCKPQSIIQDKTGYCVGSSSNNTRVEIVNVNAEENINSDDVLSNLNSVGDVFIKGEKHPLLYFEANDYPSGQKYKKSNITIDNSIEHGSIASSSTLTNMKYGDVIELNSQPDEGYRLKKYIVNDGKNITNANYYVASGKDVTISATFETIPDVTVVFPEEDSISDYYVTVTMVKDKNGDACNTPIKSGSSVAAGSILKIVPTIKNGVEPDIKDIEYTGTFSNPIFSDDKTLVVEGEAIKKTYKVKDHSDRVEIKYKLKTQGKRWTTVADTSWYDENKSTFTLTNAKQLAGVAVLCEKKKDFEGKTIKLGNDISLKNTADNCGEHYASKRSWTGIGNDVTPFRGTFDGQGHTISSMYRNFGVNYCDDGYGGLFSNTENAIIKNITINSDSYINDDGNETICGFVNGTTGGAIVGEAVNSTIEHCCANVNMAKAGSTGGIVGVSIGSKILNCTNYSTITGNAAGVGGIVGSLSSIGLITSQKTQIVSCINEGVITSKSNKVGGILGSGESCAAEVTNCINKANVDVSAVADDYGQAVGGILGSSSGAISINACVNNGNISAKNRIFSVAGIAGYLLKGSISNSYNTGTIYSDGTSSEAYVSGIAGLGSNRLFSASITNCYNAGSLELGPDCETNKIGGISAYVKYDNNSFSNNYVLDESIASISGGVGVNDNVVNSATLKNKAYDLGAAYNNDAININNGYPILSWQDPQGKGAIHRHAWRGVYQVAGFMCHGYSYEICDGCGSTRNYVNLEGYSYSYVQGFKLSKGKACFTAKWKKQNKKTQKLFSGYQVRWSIDPGMNGAGYVHVGPGKSSVKIKGFKKTRYYVQVRTYTGGFYSGWSPIKTVVTK